MKKKLIYSSETYELKIEDLLKLKKTSNYEEGKDVVLFLGNHKHKEKDALLSGYEKLVQAQKEGQEYIKTRLAYKSYKSFLGFFVGLFKYIKRNNYQEGSQIYRILFESVLENDIIRGERTLENAYSLSSNVEIPDEQDRKNEFMKLYNSIKKEGYNMKSPIIILLNRKIGIKDQVLQGHHRIGICKELGTKEISVVFWGAPRSFGFMKYIYKLLKIFGRHK